MCRNNVKRKVNIKTTYNCKIIALTQQTALRMLYTGFNVTIGLLYIYFYILDTDVLQDKSFKNNIVKTTVKNTKILNSL